MMVLILLRSERLGHTHSRRLERVSTLPCSWIASVTLHGCLEDCVGERDRADTLRFGTAGRLHADACQDALAVLVRLEALLDIFCYLEEAAGYWLEQSQRDI